VERWKYSCIRLNLAKKGGLYFRKTVGNSRKSGRRPANQPSQANQFISGRPAWKKKYTRRIYSNNVACFGFEEDLFFVSDGELTEFFYGCSV